MGVRTRIVLYAPNQKIAEKAAEAAFKRIAYLEDIMSDYRPTSEIMRLCASAGGPPVRVSKELLFILKKSVELSQKSAGALDVTVGPLVKLWRKARKSGVIPSQEEVKEAKKLIGWQKIIINERTGTVRLANRGMQIDLGGIAKGYACDEAMRILKQYNINSALIEMGGDVLVSNPPPGKKGWEIEIANLDPQHSRIVLSNCAISSSGDTQQFVEISGKRYSHIVDPRTGLGLTNRIAVTVISPSGIISDGLATAVSVLGKEKGCALASIFPATSVYVRKVTDKLARDNK
ncbi:MAG: FAD:protein FMN transferase [Armatimonadetes bacterium]|nr:FAD:protein FMN transferase [Armatimonadota bacterium]